MMVARPGNADCASRSASALSGPYSRRKSGPSSTSGVVVVASAADSSAPGVSFVA